MEFRTLSLAGPAVDTDTTPDSEANYHPKSAWPTNDYSGELALAADGLGSDSGGEAGMLNPVSNAQMAHAHASQAEQVCRARRDQPRRTASKNYSPLLISFFRSSLPTAPPNHPPSRSTHPPE